MRKGADVSLLHRVFRLPIVLENAAGDAEKPPIVLADDRPDRCLVLGERTRDEVTLIVQRGGNGPYCHGRSSLVRLLDALERHRFLGRIGGSHTTRGRRTPCNGFTFPSLWLINGLIAAWRQRP